MRADEPPTISATIHPWGFVVVALFFIPVLGAMLWRATAGTPTKTSLATVPLQQFDVEDSRSLAALFADHDFGWPPDGPVPRLAVKSLPADLAQQPASRRKSLFFRSLLPLVLAENRRLQAERSLLKRVFARGSLPVEGALRERVQAIARSHGIDGDLDTSQVRTRLLRRVDQIPPALALAQAASESGWGSSHFSRKGNNLFGERTWKATTGILPRQRPSDKHYYVRAFSSLRGSVHSYVHNLNTHRAYTQLRQLRLRIRERGKRPDAWALAGGLGGYSERGGEYVADIRAIMHHNHLVRALRNIRLAGSSAGAPAQ